MGDVLGGGAGPQQRGMPQAGGAMAAPQPQANFGPESLLALLSALFQRGGNPTGGVQGQAAGNATAVGQNSLGALLPMLLRLLQPQPQPAQGGQPGAPPQGGNGGGGLGGVGLQPGMRQAPNDGGGGGADAGQQPAQSAAGILKMLGLV